MHIETLLNSMVDKVSYSISPLFASQQPQTRRSSKSNLRHLVIIRPAYTYIHQITSNVLIHDKISIRKLLFITNSQTFWYVLFREINLEECTIFFFFLNQ